MELKCIEPSSDGRWQITGKDGKPVFVDVDRQVVKRKWQELLIAPEPKGKEVTDGAK
jgi:hypothetical protein